MNVPQILALASLTLERLGASLVDSDNDRVVIRGGIATAGRLLETSIEPLLSWLEAHPDKTRQGVASFFRGVGCAAVAPKPTRRQAGSPFTEMAAGLTPSIEGPLFSIGASLAMQREIHVEPAFGGLVTAHFVELDTGRHLVTLDQLENWGVSGERAHKAALSLLFHRTQLVQPAAYDAAHNDTDPGPDCQTFRLRDGYDASRALLIDALLYQRCRSGLLLSVPANDVLLFVDVSKVDDAGSVHNKGRAGFRKTVEEIFRKSAWALSDKVYLADDTRIVSLEP